MCTEIISKTSNKTFQTSVIMAVFNGEKYLAEQLESLAKQSQLANEIIIIDDASNDDSVKIINDFIITYKNSVIFIHHATNQGYIKSFEEGMALAHGDFIFFCDQDDVWHPDKIQNIIIFYLETNRCMVMIHDIEYIDHFGNTKGDTKIGRILEKNKTKGSDLDSYVNGMATVVKKEFLDLVLPLPKNDRFTITHDYWIHTCANALELKRVCPLVLALFRRHGRNVTEKYSIDSFKINIFTNILWLLKRFRQPSEEKLSRTIFYRSSLRDWLLEKEPLLTTLNLCDFDTLKIKINKLNMEIDLRNKRLAVLQSIGLFRVIYLSQLYCKGGYKEIGGISSFLKDLFQVVIHPK